MKKILFVCVENANRSQMAEAFLRMHGSGRFAAYSAGSRGGGAVNPRAVAAMKQRGYDLTQHRSRSLDEVPAGPYEYVVTMGCGDDCPVVPAEHREDWALPDPKNMDAVEFSTVRDEIERRVLDLIERLTSGTG